MMKKMVLTLLMTAIKTVAIAQSQNKGEYTRFYAGIGFGLDYGGVGVKVEYLPLKQLGVFAGAGANFNRVGFNAGLSYKIIPDKKVTPTLTAMYGYNAVIKVKNLGGGAVLFEKTYYGPSVGGGCDIKVGKKQNKISLGLIIPFRNAAFEDKYDELKAQGFTFNPGISPILVSIGFNFTGTGN